MNCELLFPGLVGSDYQLTSPPDLTYNCIAWAMGESDRWWWPDSQDIAFWPEGIERRETVEAFFKMFDRFGFERIDTEQLEPGKDRIALFAIGAKPTHLSRQLPSGRWASKLGSGVDIEHELTALEGEEYGKVIAIISRPNRP